MGWGGTRNGSNWVKGEEFTALVGLCGVREGPRRSTVRGKVLDLGRSRCWEHPLLWDLAVT